MHESIAVNLNSLLQSGAVPAWLNHERTLLCVQNVTKGTPHLTKPPPNLRPTTLATSEARQQNAKAITICREQAQRAQDSVLSLDELKIKIEGIDLPTNALIQEENQVLFASIEYRSKPEVKYCLP